MGEPNGKAATKAKNKYNTKAYDRFHISVKKGVKEIIEATAQKEGKSLNGYVIEALDKQLVANGQPSILGSKDGE